MESPITAFSGTLGSIFSGSKSKCSGMLNILIEVRYFLKNRQKVRMLFIDIKIDENHIYYNEYNQA